MIPGVFPLGTADSLLSINELCPRDRPHRHAVLLTPASQTGQRGRPGSVLRWDLELLVLSAPAGQGCSPAGRGAY